MSETQTEAPTRPSAEEDFSDDEKVVEETSANVIDEHNKQVKEESAEDRAKRQQEQIEKARNDLDALDPTPASEPVRRIIGKPPEHGGKNKEFAVYVQEKLPWIPRQKFFALVGRTMADSVKATGTTIGGMSDIFNDDEGGTFAERGRRWIQRDFNDIGSFATLIFELIATSDQFMLNAYCIWLNVPRDDRGWAKSHFSAPWQPDNGKWGLTDEKHEDIVNTFIDQNYEDIRRFFVEVLPAMLKRMALHERSKERTPIIRQN